MEDRRGPTADGGIVGGAARAGVAALVLAAVSCPIVFLALGLAQNDNSLFGVALWTIIGLVGATVLFLGLLFIVYDWLCRMRQDRDYWGTCATSSGRGEGAGSKSCGIHATTTRTSRSWTAWRRQWWTAETCLLGRDDGGRPAAPTAHGLCRRRECRTGVGR